MGGQRRERREVPGAFKLCVIFFLSQPRMLRSREADALGQSHAAPGKARI